MYLDEGVDTGEIIHQFRPKININDSFHQFSNRFLVNSFQTYSKIAERNLKFGLHKPFSTNNVINNRKLIYKKSDFSRQSELQLYKNLNNGMIHEYLLNKKDKCKKVPIWEQDWLAV